MSFRNPSDFEPDLSAIDELSGFEHVILLAEGRFPDGFRSSDAASREFNIV